LAVPYINKVSMEDADGLLDRIFQARTKSAGRLWEIVAVQSLNPESLRESMRMYGQIMFADSPLSRAQREMVAVVTSLANECHY
jgi:alkylhydroperoxidase family enzyme